MSATLHALPSVTKSAENEWRTMADLSGVPSRFRDCTLEDSPARVGNLSAFMSIDCWLGDKPHKSGANLVLFGPVGSGKTGIAVGCLKRLWTLGVNDLAFASAPDMIEGLRPDGKARLHDFQDPRVLVLDDLGSTRCTEWERDRIYAILQARYAYQRPTIVTTNVAIDDLADPDALGERTVSRLIDGATIVTIAGLDLRAPRR